MSIPTLAVINIGTFGHIPQADETITDDKRELAGYLPVKSLVITVESIQLIHKKRKVHMPIDIETFESAPDDRLQHDGETNADRVMEFLAAHPDKAFTQSEIREATGVKAGGISVVLSRLEDRGLVRHRGTYQALGESDDVGAYTSFAESTRTANDRFGSEKMDKWLEHAVEEEPD